MGKLWVMYGQSLGNVWDPVDKSGYRNHFHVWVMYGKILHFWTSMFKPRFLGVDGP